MPDIYLRCKKGEEWKLNLVTHIKQIIRWSYSKESIVSRQVERIERPWYLYTEQMNRILKMHNFVHLVIRTIVVHGMIHKEGTEFIFDLFAFLRGYFEGLRDCEMWTEITTSRVEEWIYLTHLNEIPKSGIREAIKPYNDFVRMLKACISQGVPEDTARDILGWRSFMRSIASLISPSFTDQVLTHIVNDRLLSFNKCVMIMMDASPPGDFKKDWDIFFKLRPRYRKLLN